MDILTSNNTTTRKFTIALQESNDKWNSLRKALRDKIAQTARQQASRMLEDDEDIGNPAQMCEELSVLRLEYTEITVQEKEDKEKIMKDYTDETISNMGNPSLKGDDAIKLRVYEKYIQLPMTSWDLPKSGVLWPRSWHWGHVQSPATGPLWLDNIRHTINTKIVEEKAK
jgi:hypothetical protein